MVGNSNSTKDTTIKSGKEKNDKFYNETLVKVIGKNTATDVYNGKYTSKQFYRNGNLCRWYDNNYRKYSKAWEKYGNEANRKDMSGTNKSSNYVTLPNGKKVKRHKR